MPAFSTRVHAWLDLVIAVALATSPWWGGFAGSNPETLVAVTVAIALAAWTLLTDHELGLVRRLQMTLHLWLDALAGIFVGASPWVFSFDQRVWIPHLAAGILLVGMAVLSQTIPGYERRGAARAGVE